MGDSRQCGQGRPASRCRPLALPPHRPLPAASLCPRNSPPPATTLLTLPCNAGPLQGACLRGAGLPARRRPPTNCSCACGCAAPAASTRHRRPRQPASSLPRRCCGAARGGAVGRRRRAGCCPRRGHRRRGSRRRKADRPACRRCGRRTPHAAAAERRRRRGSDRRQRQDGAGARCCRALQRQQLVPGNAADARPCPPRPAGRWRHLLLRQPPARPVPWPGGRRRRSLPRGAAGASGSAPAAAAVPCRHRRTGPLGSGPGGSSRQPGGAGRAAGGRSGAGWSGLRSVHRRTRHCRC